MLSAFEAFEKRSFSSDALSNLDKEDASPLLLGFLRRF